MQYVTDANRNLIKSYDNIYTFNPDNRFNELKLTAFYNVFKIFPLKLIKINFQGYSNFENLSYPNDFYQSSLLRIINTAHNSQEDKLKKSELNWDDISFMFKTFDQDYLQKN